jgi:hypothetical protein
MMRELSHARRQRRLLRGRLTGAAFLLLTAVAAVVASLAW